MLSSSELGSHSYMSARTENVHCRAKHQLDDWNNGGWERRPGQVEFPVQNPSPEGVVENAIGPGVARQTRNCRQIMPGNLDQFLHFKLERR